MLNRSISENMLLAQKVVNDIYNQDLKNNCRLLSNLNQTVNQICKSVKINNTDIELRSGNSLHQRENPLRDSQTQKINYQKK
jgi:hypothetical protein